MAEACKKRRNVSPCYDAPKGLVIKWWNLPLLGKLNCYNLAHRKLQFSKPFLVVPLPNLDRNTWRSLSRPTEHGIQSEPLWMLLPLLPWTSSETALQPFHRLSISLTGFCGAIYERDEQLIAFNNTLTGCWLIAHPLPGIKRCFSNGDYGHSAKGPTFHHSRLIGLGKPPIWNTKWRRRRKRATSRQEASWDETIATSYWIWASAACQKIPFNRNRGTEKSLLWRRIKLLSTPRVIITIITIGSLY